MKFGIIILTILFLILGCMPASFAWSPATHHQIVVETYNSLSDDMKQNLDLNAMIDGSDDPDMNFMDFENHRYPASVLKAQEWLDRAKDQYNQGNYKEASYSYGVASHYISDTYSGPHTVKGVDGFHQMYEIQAIFLEPKIDHSVKVQALSLINNEKPYMALKSDISEDIPVTQKNWEGWMSSWGNSYIQKDLNNAAEMSYLAIGRHL